ncbi:sulfotransferase domain-containing protein [Mangrovimonas futianensis]|uniref:sulfotransferase domain-containing protein n=1 Tax=Mangrovimonas futianensis TaxID=2895523 RepID=UPI001E5CA577|nr:sulfotransferase domain-containing protein [Mangrovimonas futianensis]MCF1420924.1 sulfotransferase domain-containing protein [Mangrovimonas futianensis]
MRKVDFICIGAQKAGTTTLHEILNQHPELGLPKRKETHFFSNTELFNKGLEHYFSYFKNKETYEFLGEIDPEYAFNEGSAKRIYKSFGRVKVVFLLRNPVDRALSHYLMTKRRGLEERDFEEAILEENLNNFSSFQKMHFSYLSRGLYYKQVKNYFDIFGRDNVKIILFEDFTKDLKKSICEISEFIGLPEFNFNTDIKSNPAASARFKKVQSFIYRDNSLKKIGGKLLESKELKRKIMQKIESLNLKKEAKPQVSLAFKRKIFLKYFEQDIDRLESLTDLNLEEWKL